VNRCLLTLIHFIHTRIVRSDRSFGGKLIVCYPEQRVCNSAITPQNSLSFEPRTRMDTLYCSPVAFPRSIWPVVKHWYSLKLGGRNMAIDRFQTPRNFSNLTVCSQSAIKLKQPSSCLYNVIHLMSSSKRLVEAIKLNHSHGPLCRTPTWEIFENSSILTQ